MKISRILHAGYVFESQGTQLLFDPIFENPFSRNCHAFPPTSFDLDGIRQLTPDAIFISHFHDDHCSFDSLDLLPRSTPVYLYCLFDELFAMLRELGFTNVQALAIDVPVQVGGFEVTARRALDDEVDSMFQLRAEGLNVLNVVDAWMDPHTLEQLKQFAPWDMVLWPFQTMREVDVIAPSRARAAAPELEAPDPGPSTVRFSVQDAVQDAAHAQEAAHEAAQGAAQNAAQVAAHNPAQDAARFPPEWPEQLQALNPRYVVPSSCQFVQEPWSWYNHAMFPITYRQFGQAVAAWLPAAQVLRLDPSVAVELTAHALTPAAPLSWVLPQGEQDVDFEYDPTLTPPPTADIACRFPALTAAQAAQVLEFCREGLLRKYEDMELADDSCFQQPCVWQLTVYDHDGAGQRFRYRIHGDTIAPVDDEEAPTWTTEIPAAKLYAGLALGESLTSMYLRIAGPQVEADPDTDIADDPLIRCLFNDAFGAYQAAQLRRLTGVAKSGG